MSDTFTLAGTIIDMNAMNAIPVHFRETFGAVPVLVIQVRGGPLPGLPDPWLGKVVTWKHTNTYGTSLYFTGDVIGMNPHFDQHVGWVINYTCAGVRNRLDYIPHTDNATGLDISPFNLTLTDPNVNLARSGRTVGQMLGQTGIGILLMGGDSNSPTENPGNLQNLANIGVGNLGSAPGS